ncbi:hypothetical protein [Goekera deserti]
MPSSRGVASSAAVVVGTAAVAKTVHGQVRAPTEPLTPTGADRLVLSSTARTLTDRAPEVVGV